MENQDGDEGRTWSKHKLMLHSYRLLPLFRAFPVCVQVLPLDEIPEKDRFDLWQSSITPREMIVEAPL